MIKYWSVSEANVIKIYQFNRAEIKLASLQFLPIRYYFISSSHQNNAIMVVVLLVLWKTLSLLLVVLFEIWFILSARLTILDLASVRLVTASAANLADCVFLSPDVRRERRVSGIREECTMMNYIRLSAGAGQLPNGWMPWNYECHCAHIESALKKAAWNILNDLSFFTDKAYRIPSGMWLNSDNWIS